MAYLQALRRERHLRPVDGLQRQLLRHEPLQAVPWSCHNGAARHLDQPRLVEAGQEPWQRHGLLLGALLLLWLLLLLLQRLGRTLLLLLLLLLLLRLLLLWLRLLCLQLLQRR